MGVLIAFAVRLLSRPLSGDPVMAELAQSLPGSWHTWLDHEERLLPDRPARR
ncbi:hypothetical protein FHX34_10153 [Actinoplanes teichomyceticus]|uniref:Uncharacterized protein n=1 Tax=Actinoplanes teichomyceticus TaxID=1867 RepID=A0A561WMJ1_ACTTI|nr:hypothetical protein FHX34_10153 [Actinoplanes teichomyceticus]